MNSYSGKYLSGQTRLPHCPHCLPLFIQLEKLHLCLTQPGMNLKNPEAVKMDRKIVLGSERMKIVLSDIDTICKEDVFLGKRIMSLCA